MVLPTPDVHATCLITGASSGIGAEIARGLARRGHGVTLVARRRAPLVELASEISAEHGVSVEVVVADVSDGQERRRMLAEVRKRKRHVSVLVNNAGFGSGGSFTELDLDHEVSMVQTNVEAIVGLCGACLPDMRERGAGAVLNLASLIAFQPVPFQATYGASKAFVLSFSEALNEELRGSGVSVSAVCPGPVRTGFGAAGGFGGADERIPGVLWLSAQQVAVAALDGLQRGERVIVPGAVNRIASLYGQHLPRTLLLPLVRRFWPVGEGTRPTG